jgi:hypothetical protein
MWIMRKTLILTLAAAVVLVTRGPSVAESKKPLYLPVSKSAILRGEGKEYLVKGETTIPEGVEISIQKGITIRGVGKDPAIRLKGSLKIHGVTDKEVRLIGVAILLEKKFGTLHLDAVLLDGKGVGTVGGAAAAGMVVLENALFNMGAKIDIKLSSGSADLFSIAAYEPSSVVVVPPKGSDTNKVQVRVQGCDEGPDGEGGFKGGLTVSGAKELILRRNALGGKKCVFSNCADVMFDMNKVTCKTLVFEQKNAKAFSRMKFMKSDIHATKVSFSAPKPEKGAVTVVANKCWWAGLVKPKEIHERIITDGHDDEKVGVKVKLGKISKRRLGFAGK